jgi:hypothetical protein
MMWIITAMINGQLLTTGPGGAKIVVAVGVKVGEGVEE